MDDLEIPITGDFLIPTNGIISGRPDSNPPTTTSSSATAPFPMMAYRPEQFSTPPASEPKENASP